MVCRVHRLFAILVIVLSSTLLAQAPDTLWTKTIGYDVGEYFTSIEKTSNGGFILAGFTESFSGDSSAEYWLVRLNNSADTVWTKVYPAAEKHDNQIALQTADGGFAIGGDGDPWLIKTDANGTVEWEQAISTIGAYNEIRWIETTANNGFIACGSGQVENISYALVVKTDSLGVPVWVDSLRGEHDMTAEMVIETTDGGVAVVGAKQHPTGGGVFHGWLQKLSASGDSLWSVVYGDTANAEFSGIQETADGGFILIGRLTLPSDSTSDIYLVKTDSLGVVEWEQTFGGTNDDEGMAVIQTSDTGFTLIGAGFVDTTFVTLVIHTAANGDTLWTIGVGGPAFDVGFGLVELGENEYLIAGARIDWDLEIADGWLVRLGDPTAQSTTGAVAGVPEAFALHANYPNPFNPSTTIGFDLPLAAIVTLTVYDILGREVVRLENRPMGAGYHQAVWDGRTSDGREAPTGIYFAQLVTPTSTRAIKMVLLK